MESQQQAFPIEFLLLQKLQPLKGQSQFTSEFQLIKVGGRFKNANIPASEKPSIPLPRRSHISWIYVRHLHLRDFHVGPNGLGALNRLEI